MRQRVLLDTGPLVALINPRDDWHDWAVSEWASIAPPLLTCEAVISEACFLLRNVHRGVEAVMILLETGIIQVAFQLGDEVASVRSLLSRYQSVPMSIADACLVQMTEQDPRLLLTLDSDFLIYRRQRNQPISLIIPNPI